MSLHEAYTLAHTAQCRLQIAAGRPDRNLRYLVGHLMHYESLRLRIVEIEHHVSRDQRAKTIQFNTADTVDHRLQHKPSTGNLNRKSPPPPASTYNDDDDSDEDPDDLFDDDDEDAADLSLERFPSGASRPQQPPPDLEPDDSDNDSSDDDEPHSPEDPDQETLEKCMQGDGNELYATMYEGIRKCSCHGKSDAPSFERMWELPPDKAHPAKDGVTRAIAQVRDENISQIHSANPIAVQA